MKWLVVSGCGALFALGCSGVGVDGGSATGAGPMAVGGTTAVAGSSYGAASGEGMPVGAGGSAMNAAGSSSLPMGGAESSGCTAGSSSLPMGGYGAAAGSSSMSAGGESVEMGGYGAGGSVDPNSCSHDVARCFDAAAACFENSPWSNCEQIVDVCAAMETECKGVGGMMAADGTGASSN